MSPLNAFDNTTLTTHGAQLGAEAQNAALDSDFIDLPPDLVDIAKMWATVPDDAKAAIKVMFEAISRTTVMER